MFGSLMVFVVVALVAITGYAMIFIAYWDKLGKEDHHYGIPIVGMFLILVRISCYLGLSSSSHWLASQDSFPS